MRPFPIQFPGDLPEPPADHSDPMMGKDVLFTPHGEPEFQISGKIMNVVRNQAGAKGYNVFAPVVGDPYRVLRLWESQGTFRVMRTA